MKSVFFLVVLAPIFLIQISSCSFSVKESLNKDINYKWKLTFEDNFDTFDETKWVTHLANGNRTIWFGKELQWYKDENVKVENGILQLISKKESVYGKDAENEKQFDYSSGIICSSRGFTQAYGKWEMRVKFPFRKGYWPAFWLIPTQIPPLPEIDVYEYFGIHKNKISSAHHWGLDYPSPYNDYWGGTSDLFYKVRAKETEGNFSDVWMVWSFEWFPDKMIWKLDGNTVFEATDGIPTAPLYILINVAVKDKPENNYKVDNSALPYITEIDYVRVYQMEAKK